VSNLYLLGHLGFTAVMGFVLDKKLLPETISSSKLSNFHFFKWFLLLLGSMIPDIIDKPLGILIFSTGRWFGHTLLLILLESFFLIILLRFSNKRYKFALYFLIGNLMHIILDQPSLGIAIPFFPLFPDPFIVTEWNSFLFGIKSPIVWLTEFLGLIILLTLGKYYKMNKIKWVGLSLLITSYFAVYLALYYFWVLII